MGSPRFCQPGKAAFQKKEDREAAELYSLGRTIQAVAMSSVLNHQSAVRCQVHQIAEEDSAARQAAENLAAEYLANEPSAIQKSLALMKEYYSQEVCDLVKSLLTERQALSAYRSMASALSQTAESLQKKQQLFVEIERRKLRKRSYGLLYCGSNKFEDVLKECLQLEQYDLGLELMQELSSQQRLRNPVFAYYYQCFLYHKESFSELRAFVAQVSALRLYREYKAINHEYYVKNLLFADFKEAGQLDKALAVLDSAIAEATTYYSPRKPLLLAQFYMRKAEVIKSLYSEEFATAYFRATTEALRILDALMGAEPDLQTRLYNY